MVGISFNYSFLCESVMLAGRTANGFYSQRSLFKAGCSSQYRLRGHSSIFIFSTLIFEAGYFNSPDCEDIFFLFSCFGKKSPKFNAV